jgi:hypothetical protein
MRQDLKRLLRSDLLSFARKALTETSGETMPEDRYLELLAGRLADLVTGDSKRLIVNLPPRHFKTWMGSICLSAWILGHHPSAKILMLTHGQELADKIARAVRAIMRSAWYKELFKKTRLASSKLDDFATTAGGAVRSVSMEGGVTGYGADYIIVDDPTELKDCDNVKRLERVVDLFQTEILTRLNNPKRGRVVIIAHRVNEDDLSGHLLAQQGRWRHLKLPLIAMRRRVHKLPDGETWVREKGELLRPDASTRDRAVPSREEARVRDAVSAKPRRDKAPHQVGELWDLSVGAGADVRFRCGAQRGSGPEGRAAAQFLGHPGLAASPRQSFAVGAVAGASALPGSAGSCPQNDQEAQCERRLDRSHQPGPISGVRDSTPSGHARLPDHPDRRQDRAGSQAAGHYPHRGH